MIKFKRKDFTIPEGHYTGPKDVVSLPGTLETVSKTTVAGSLIGAVAGHYMKDSSIIEGAFKGAGAGILTGIATKLFLNYIHKPMSSAKFQDIDRGIRRQFSMYNLGGVVIGDSLKHRAKFDEKFSTNDREITKYKVTVAVHRGQLTLYTFGMTREELDKTSKTLDYYCKKYYGMEYTARAINLKLNSYAVNITFTNTQVICSFIVELSEVLNTPINLLDHSASIEGRILEATNKMEEVTEEEEKEFSVSAFSKYDLIKMLGTSGAKIIRLVGRGPSALPAIMIDSILQGINELTNRERESLAAPGMAKSEYSNRFLEAALSKNRYVESFHFTVGSDKNPVNFSMNSGLFIVTSTKKEATKIDKGWYGKYSDEINRSDTGEVIVYTYPLKNVNAFDEILKRFMDLGLKPNLYDKPALRNSTFSNNNMIDMIVDKLDRDGEEDYEISSKIPKDVISITADPTNVRIYIPRSLDYCQYDIDDEVRLISKFIRTNTNYERGINVMKLSGPLTFQQYYKLVKSIIKNQGFCTFLTND